ncbi:MAG: helix-turn-helix transcriptional regulator [Clostridia bacterium]|nr:helix-turn-helix transcriptional regulator [Clostridia bacterium]
MNQYKNRIRDLREDRDLRQIDVANATGIDQKTLSNYETGKTNPDSYSIIRLAEFFGVTTDYLLGCSDSSFRSKKDVLNTLSNIEKEIRDLKLYFSK